MRPAVPLPLLTPVFTRHARMRWATRAASGGAFGVDPGEAFAAFRRSVVVADGPLPLRVPRTPDTAYLWDAAAGVLFVADLLGNEPGKLRIVTVLTAEGRV